MIGTRNRTALAVIATLLVVGIHLPRAGWAQEASKTVKREVRLIEQGALAREGAPKRRAGTPAPSYRSPGARWSYRPEPVGKLVIAFEEWHGATLKPVRPAMRAQLAIPEGTGLVVDVGEDSDAWKSGLRPHDIILQALGKPIATVAELRNAIEAHDEKKADVQLLRKGDSITVALDLDLLRRSKRHYSVSIRAEPRYWIGVSLGAVDLTLQMQLMLADAKGALVTQVHPDGPADRAGIEKFDIVRMVAESAVGSAQELVERIQESKGKPIVLGLLRGGKAVSVEVTPETREQAGSMRLLVDELEREGATVSTVPGVVLPLWKFQQSRNVATPDAYYRSTVRVAKDKKATTEAKLLRMIDQVESLAKEMRALRAELDARRKDTSGKEKDSKNDQSDDE